MMPKAVLDVTVKDEEGKEIFSKQREFTVNDLYFKGGKQVAMAEWDVTATEHFDLGVKPLTPYHFTYLIPLESSTKSVTVEASFQYLYSRERTFDLRNVSKTVNVQWD